MVLSSGVNQTVTQWTNWLKQSPEDTIGWCNGVEVCPLMPSEFGYQLSAELQTVVREEVYPPGSPPDEQPYLYPWALRSAEDRVAYNRSWLADCWESAVHLPHEWSLPFAIRYRNETVGFFRFFAKPPYEEQRHLEIMDLLVQKSYRGQRIGISAVYAALAWGFHYLGAQVVQAAAYRSNEAARKTFKRVFGYPAPDREAGRFIFSYAMEFDVWKARRKLPPRSLENWGMAIARGARSHAVDMGDSVFLNSAQELTSEGSDDDYHPFDTERRLGELYMPLVRSALPAQEPAARRAMLALIDRLVVKKFDGLGSPIFFIGTEDQLRVPILDWSLPISGSDTVRWIPQVICAAYSPVTVGWWDLKHNIAWAFSRENAQRILQAFRSLAE